jgi:GT2 family glycosyltransferase/glycosyltransferase involved in cell wall biosynthesis
VVELSICIPTFNGLPFIRDALDSLLTQTHKDFEILISDDGSVDGTLALLEDFVEGVPGSAKLFKNKDLGIARNCNFLANESTGLYIKYLFQDDILEPSCIEVLLNEAKRSRESTLIFSDRKVLFESLDSPYCQDIFNGCQNLSEHWERLSSVMDGNLYLEDPNLLESPINKIGEPSNTLIYRKAFQEVGGFDPEFSQLLDLDLWLRLMSVGKVSYVNQTLSSFRIHDSQESVANLTKGNLSDDFELLCKKLVSSKFFAGLSEGFKSRALAKLKDSLERTMIPGREKIELMHKIDSFSQRMKFMESTFAWRARKCFMKSYYWIFPGRRKNKSLGKIVYYHPIKFSTYGKISFKKHESPLCSIVIPFYGQTELTWLCLKALELNIENHIAVEILLVDDNSNDSTKLINSLDGVRVVRNSDNIGFLNSCNKAASLSRGEYLVFLNNDTQIQKGWLTPLIDLLSSGDDIGAVGSKLLYPDNTLQEAGGIIWRDGTGCNYGKGKNHNEPQFNYVRLVDYCSGASFATSRDLFLGMNGFSEQFAPAYYEDTDFCFRLRQNGHRVIYQPKSVLLHCEGATCGTSEESGVKSNQYKNRYSFSAKWSHQLANHFEPNGSFLNQYQAANRLNGTKSILVIDTYLPFHDRESGGHRLFQILLILRKLGYQVSFLPHNQKFEEPYVSELQQKGIEVLIFREPISDIRKQISKRLEKLDIVWICRPQMYREYGSFIRKRCKARIIYDTIDLHFIRVKRQWEFLGKKSKKLHRKWVKFLRDEKSFSRHCDLVLTVTKDEALEVCNWGNEKTFIVPNIHLCTPSFVPCFKDRSGVLFIGSYLHTPNIDAAKWLVHEIMPLVWQKNPETHLFLLGSNPTSEILKLRRSGVCVTGFVKDVKPYFDQVKAFVAPLRYGAGMKGKVGQSMSLGLPVVTTAIGAEGMNLINGKHAFISDDPVIIAQNISTLGYDEAKWNELSTAGIRHMGEYSPEVVSGRIERMITSLK